MSRTLKEKLFPALLALPLLFVVMLLVQGPDKEIVKEKIITPSLSQDKIEKESVPIVEVIKDIILPEKKPELFEYVQVTDGCGVNFQGACVNVRTAPETTAPSVYKLRNGVILRVKDKITSDGRDWYEVYFDEWLRYPERVKKHLYVAADFVEPFLDEGIKETASASTTKTTKRIVVDRGEQMLYAYEGDELFMKEKVSTGLELTPTPRGTFTIYKKTPSRYMQGPIPGISTHYYDLPGVPWNLYFSNEGAVIHGAYWHNSFGKQWSNGCVNLPIASAEKIYKWADVGTKVLVRD